MKIIFNFIVHFDQPFFFFFSIFFFLPWLDLATFFPGYFFSLKLLKNVLFWFSSCQHSFFFSKLSPDSDFSNGF